MTVRTTCTSAFAVVMSSRRRHRSQLLSGSMPCRTSSVLPTSAPWGSRRKRLGFLGGQEVGYGLRVKIAECNDAGKESSYDAESAALVTLDDGDETQLMPHESNPPPPRSPS
ncbi:Hypothetical protein, putative [Bodo saltans]|uniref:Uncharacterized protein n=1 Tax=Bodo saltans TaxID=75058 RepID=A0A0S4INK5_BODSA|nr:Hypothetical protein, putative [Bodo saltans]|eukprot:CUE61480.1 Hypothetical protein, putative [Bodo saltans]